MCMYEEYGTSAGKMDICFFGVCFYNRLQLRYLTCQSFEGGRGATIEPDLIK